MKKNITIWLVSILFSVGIKAQCDTSLIPNPNYSLFSVSSQHANFPALNAIDGDSTTAWKSGNGAFPHEYIVDLGQSYNLNGVGILSKTFTPLNGKLKEFELYISNDTLNWGTPEVSKTLSYQSSSSIENKEVFFGTVAGRYVKLKALSNVYDANATRLFIAELTFYKDSCQATGQHNQIISFPAISKKTTTDTPFKLNATSTSGLPITYHVISGPATLQNDTLVLTGNAGTVKVKAIQVGGTNYFPTESVRTFQVVDLASFYPTVSCLLSDSFPIEMPQLYAYPIYSSTSISEPSILKVDSLVYSINGDVLKTNKRNGKWVALWYPPAYGDYTIQAIAYANNGNITTESIDITVTNQIGDRSVLTLDKALIHFGNTGQWHYEDFELPQFVGAYDEIIAHLDFGCPNVNGGCDDWDRLAYVEVKGPDGDWKEIIRYITPYGVACSHSTDITHFASILQGKVSMRVYVGTWGTGGWEVTLNLDYNKGTPQYLYTSVEELWHGTYNFGNPKKLQPLDTLKLNVGSQVSKAEMVMINTGHGWGANNSQNAAEFYEATHQLRIDNQLWYSQQLWTQCNPNPDNCTGQQGTWYYPRAGWCPGAISQPFTYDLSSYIGTGDFELAYIFDPSYIDFCHPSHPNCVTGVTCTDCNAGSNPIYRIGSYVIRYSNQPLLQTPQTNIENRIDKIYELSLFPNPNNGQFYVNLEGEHQDLRVLIYNVEGKILKRYFFDTQEDLQQHSFHLEELEKGTYFLSIDSKYFSETRTILLQ